MQQYPLEIPDIVKRAKNLANDIDFDLRPEGNLGSGCKTSASACIDEVGSLLRTLAASLPQGRIGEVGTGSGVGSAWITSGLASGATLTTVEINGRLAQAARSLFTDYGNVEVFTGNWLEVMPDHAPFDLLFFDGGAQQAFQKDNWQKVASLLKPFGIMIIDDLTPEEDWPESWRNKPDAKRELAFKSGLFTATEIRSRKDSATLVLVKNPRQSN